MTFTGKIPISLQPPLVAVFWNMVAGPLLDKDGQ